MKKLLAAALVLVLLGAFGGTIAFLWKKSKKPPVVYPTATPFRATIVQKTVATGAVVPRKEITIKPQVSGIVAELLVEPGDQVARGDLVARVNIVPNMVSLANAENRVNRARINLANARRDLDRNTRLRAEGVVSQATLDQYQVAEQNAEEELGAAIDNRELVQKGTTAKNDTASNTLVRATVAGMVLDVPVEVGSSVIEANTFNDGTTIATIADMTELIFKGRVDESEVGKIKPGMDLLLTIGAIAGRRFDAKLEHIAPKGVAQDGAIQFEIRAALARPDDAFIRANLSANADIVLARRDDVLAIKEGLLQFDDGKPFVEVETAPQSFARRPIETGLSDGIDIEIVSGLTLGDRIKDAAKGAIN